MLRKQCETAFLLIFISNVKKKQCLKLYSLEILRNLAEILFISHNQGFGESSFLKISKTVCYNLVNWFLKNEESMRVTSCQLCENL